MDLRRIAPFVPIVFGAIVAIMWVTVQGTAALVVTIAGGAMMGLFYAYLGSRDDDDAPADRPVPPSSL